MVNWSGAGKSELIYIDTHNGRTRAELRSPDASGNPYLVYALLIHAGLYGLENALALPEEMDENSLMLPTSRKEAAELAKKSEFVKSIIPEEILREYTDY